MIVERTVLLDAVRKAAEVAGRRSTVEILQHCVIEQDGQVAELVATDMDQAVHLVVWPIQGAGRMRCVVPAKRLADVLAAMRCRLVMIDQCAGQLEDHSDGLVFVVAMDDGVGDPMPIDPGLLSDYPAQAYKGPETVVAAIDVPYPYLEHIADSVRRAASTDETRPVLTQVRFQLNGNLQVAATNSYILFRGQWECAPLMDGTFLVDAKLLAKVVKHARKVNPASVLFEAGENGYLRIHVPGVGTYLSRMRDGQFPNVDQLWPNDRGTLFHIHDVADAIGKVKQAASMSSEKHKPLVLGSSGVGTATDGGLWVSDSGGRTQLRIGAGRTGEERIEWGVNADYLVEALRAVGDSCELSVRTPLRPFTLTGKTQVECLLMPMRLSFGPLIGRPGEDEKPEPTPEPEPKPEPRVERVVVAKQRHVDAVEPAKPKRPGKPPTDEQCYRRVERLRKQGATYAEAFAAVAETEPQLRSAQIAARYYRFRRSQA